MVFSNTLRAAQGCEKRSSLCEGIQMLIGPVHCGLLIYFWLLHFYERQFSHMEE